MIYSSFFVMLNAMTIFDLLFSSEEGMIKFFDMVYPMDNFTEAINKALDMAGDSGAVLVCGSLYLASQLRPLIVRCLKKRGKDTLIDIEN